MKTFICISAKIWKFKDSASAHGAITIVVEPITSCCDSVAFPLLRSSFNEHVYDSSNMAAASSKFAAQSGKYPTSERSNKVLE